MYLYSLSDWDEFSVLQHDKKFTKEEFDKICKEAPKTNIGHDCYDVSYIYDYLIKNYGFRKLKYTSFFDCRQDIEK